MKNKEIEELFNDIKKHDYEVLNREDYSLLLSYIEQLKKRNKEIYEGFMATQEELTDYATKNEQLENENQQLKKQKDDVIKVLYHLKGSARWERHLYEVDYMLRMLGEIDVED